MQLHPPQPGDLLGFPLLVSPCYVYELPTTPTTPYTPRQGGDQGATILGCAP